MKIIFSLILIFSINLVQAQSHSGACEVSIVSNGKSYGAYDSKSISRTKIANATKLEFPENCKYSIISFEVSYLLKGEVKTQKFSGDKLGKEFEKIISIADSSIYIEAFKIKDLVSDKFRTMPSIGIHLKE